MLILQFGSKLYEACDGKNPELLFVKAIVDVKLNIQLTLEIDETPIIVNMADSTTLAEYDELIGYLGKLLVLHPINKHQCQIVDTLLKNHKQPEEEVIVETVSEVVEETPCSPTTEATTVETPEQTAPCEKQSESKSKESQAGAPSRTKGCAFRNRSF